MKNKNLLRSISVLIIICFVASVGLDSLAVTQSDVDALKEKGKQANEELTNITENKTEAQSALESINEKLAKAEDNLESLKAQLAEKNDKIEAKKDEIGEEEKEIEAKNELLKERMVALYEAGDTSYIDVLLNSEDLLDFISGYSAIQTIVEADTNLINELENKKEQLEKDKQELENDKQKVEELKKEQEIQNATLVGLQDNKKKEVSKLSSDQQAKQAEIDKVNEDIAKAEKDIAEIAKNKNSNGHVYTGGTLTWPCPGYTRISDYFGYRSASSTEGVGSTNHKGIDMAAPQGTNILAATDGTVASAGWYGGYGNCIIINHGNGLSTLYGHCSKIIVNAGDNVKAGDKIGEVGSTGNSTGPHLHFSVLLNGVYVNPASYLGM